MAAGALLLAAGWLIPRPGSDPLSPAPTAQVQLMEIATGRVTSRVRVPHPLEIHYDSGVFWVLRGNEDNIAVSFVGIEESSGAVIHEFASPYTSVGSFLPRGDALWVTDYDSPEVARIDPRTGQVVQRIDLSGGPPSRFRGTSRGAEQLVPAVDSLWIGRTGEVAQVDLDSGRVIRRVPLPYEWGMTVAGGRVWVARQDGVTWIDPVTGRQGPVAPILRPQNLVAVGDGVWAADPYGSLYAVSTDGTSRLLSQSAGLGRPLELSRTSASVWTADGSSTITETVLTDGQRRRFPFDRPLQTLAAGQSQVAVTMDEAVPVPRDSAESTSDPGNTLRLAWSRSTGDPLDPALIDASANPWMAQLQRLTCRQLMRVAVGASGPQPVPDLANDQPRVSADGLTYRFTVRRQQIFAPPVSRPVTAEDVRFSIERAVAAAPSGTAPAPAAELLRDVVGLSRFLHGDQRHIAGIAVADSSLTIRLQRPVPDLLWRLSLPSLCVVADGSPLPAELVPPVSAGPYFITEHANGGSTVLSRNPNATEDWGRLDATTVIIDEAASPVDAANQVADGTIQHASFDDAPSTTSTVTAGGAETGPLGHRTSPLMGVHYLAFNARRPPLDDSRIRIALSVALDPADLANHGSTIPSRALLPIRVAESHVTRQSKPQVRSVDVGRTLSIGYLAGCGSCAIDAERIARQLGEAGVATTRRALGQPYLTADLDLAIGATRLPYPDPATFLVTMLGEDVPHTWLSSETRRQVEQLGKLQGSMRLQEANAQADRLRDEAPIAVYATDIMDELTSGIICSEVPTAGLDLATCTRDGTGPRPQPTR